MQVSTSKVVAKFEAFDLKIRVESKEEAQALYAIFNYNPNAMLISDMVADEIKAAIGEQYYVSDDCGGKEVIANGVTYNQYYK